MSAFLRLAALFASLSLTQALLAGCGGGQGADSSSGAEAYNTAGSQTGPTGSNGDSVTFAKPHPQTDAKTQAERHQAGNAAPFVEPGVDNSVPTFGTEASAAERAKAAASLQTYLRARAAEDWTGACRRLAKPVRRGFEKLGHSSSKSNLPACAAVLAALSKGADLTDPFNGSLLSLRVHGANAFALFYGPGHQRYIVPMNREGGAWRPTQAAPITYPPGTP